MLPDNITMEGINKISSLLDSTDPELQELAMIMCGRNIDNHIYAMPAFRRFAIHNCKTELCDRAYKLGQQTAEQLNINK